MTIQIEKNIPMPQKARGKYPWKSMEVGDSFVFEHRHGYEMARVATARNAPRKFVAKTVNGVLRIWRTE